MQAGELIAAALKALGHPVARIFYKGKASIYFTFQLIAGIPTAFADDDNTASESTWRVDLYSKSDYTTLLSGAIAALKGAGCYGVVVEAEQYETETGFFHVSLETKYLEE